MAGAMLSTGKVPHFVFDKRLTEKEGAAKARSETSMVDSSHAGRRSKSELDRG